MRCTVVLVSLVVAACSSGSRPKPVAECVAYRAAFEKCFQRPPSAGEQDALIPKTEADREPVRELCVGNLERLNATCR